MILVDTSAWVEFLRATGSAMDQALTRLVERGADLVISEPIVMEILTGGRTEREVAELRSGLLAFPLLSVAGLHDYEDAAAIHRACRQGGETIRSQMDCLIAAVAIRSDASLLHADTDFDVIARHTDLRVGSVGP